jgi:hypothetical protein
MCVRALGFLEQVAQLKPGAVLPCLLREGMVEGLSRILAQCALMVGVAGGGALVSEGVAGALPLASAIVYLLLSLVGVAPSQAGREMVFSSLQLHWTSYTGEWYQNNNQARTGRGGGSLEHKFKPHLFK